MYIITEDQQRLFRCNRLKTDHIFYICQIIRGRRLLSGYGTMLQAGRSRIRFPMKGIQFSIYIIFPAALGPKVHLASNRNQYQKQENYVSGE
jgi:hypothetical protein